jgi:hypothetical protein
MLVKFADDAYVGLILRQKNQRIVLVAVALARWKVGAT